MCWRKFSCLFLVRLSLAGVRPAYQSKVFLHHVFRLEGLPVGGENELGFLLRRRLTLAQSGKRRRHIAFRAYLNMDVVALKDTSWQVRLICIPAPQPLEHARSHHTAQIASL